MSKARRCALNVKVRRLLGAAVTGAALSRAASFASVMKSDDSVFRLSNVVQKQSTTGDSDGDGIPDSVEASLAARYAPVFLYGQHEQNFPLDVASILAHTSLYVYEAGCAAETTLVAKGALTVDDLRNRTYSLGCSSSTVLKSDGTRSVNKQESFYLADLPAPIRAGGQTPQQWTTYYHAYPNANDGVTIQYWRCYGFNQGPQKTVLGQTVNFSHGGDWETVDVVLGRENHPDSVRVPGHVHIRTVPWTATTREGLHVTVYVEEGGHESHDSVPPGWLPGIRHESWPGGKVTGQHRTEISTGPLVNLGEKTRPMQWFIRYSGLWGSPGYNYYGRTSPLVKAAFQNLFGYPLVNFTSGYWGPAYNETDRRPDGFITAWCNGYRPPLPTNGDVRECYPQDESR